MRFFKLKMLITLSACMVSTVEAAPTNISAMKVSTATKIYTLFTFDAVKLNKQGLAISQALADLTNQLALSTNPVITPCQIPGDVNATGISCGGGIMKFGTNEFFTTTAAINLPGLPFKTIAGVNEQFGGNFLAPNGLIPGDSAGRVVSVRFNQRMAQFGFLVDPGASVNGIQFIVNHQPVPVQALTPATPQFVGVEDSAGFTEVTIIASGSTRSWIADQFSYLPLANF